VAEREGLVAIIPARGGSKRLPRKNVRLLAGKTLVQHAIDAARDSGLFRRICVTSEDPEVLGLASVAGVDAQVRPAELATDSAQVKQVCHDLIQRLEGEGDSFASFCVLLPTNPLRTGDDLRAAHAAFASADADILMSLVPFSHPPQRAVWAPTGLLEPYFGQEYMRPAQQIETLYRHDGSFIFARCEVFLREPEFYGRRVMPYWVEADASVDIDSALDLEFAEFLLERRRRTLPS
jgi:CMP-N-acetylneuraminic acid synthetase